MHKTQSGVVSEALSAHSLGERHRAVELCDRGIQRYPDLAPLLHLRGVLYFEEDDFPAAVDFIERAIGLNQGAAEYHNSLGVVWKSLGENEKARGSYGRALGLRPNFAEACNNLGELFTAEGDLKEAETYYRRALSFNRGYTDALYNLGNLLKRLGRLEEALEAYDRCLGLDPGYEESAWNRGLTHLLMGNYTLGWEDYELRFSQTGFPSRRTDLGSPLWRGEPLKGKKILVYSEQGYGDTFHFVRFLSLLIERGGQVLLECRPRLKCQLETLNLPVKVITSAAEAGEVDYHLPLMSVPHRCDESAALIGEGGPYLSAPEKVCREVTRRFVSRFKEGRTRVGIQWQGDPEYCADEDRSIPLSFWGDLLSLEEVQWVSLQKGVGIEQLEEFPSVLNLGAELDEGEDGFVETAALIKELDLVISSDTALVHLAGAIGCPAWLLLGEHPDWRWGLTGTTSPWYPSLTLFRQEVRGEWGPLIRSVRESLREYLRERQ